MADITRSVPGTLGNTNLTFADDSAAAALDMWASNPQYGRALGYLTSAFGPRGPQGGYLPGAAGKPVSKEQVDFAKNWADMGYPTQDGGGFFGDLFSGIKDMAGVIGPIAGAAMGFNALAGLQGLGAGALSSEVASGAGITDEMLLTGQAAGAGGTAAGTVFPGFSGYGAEALAYPVMDATAGITTNALPTVSGSGITDEMLLTGQAPFAGGTPAGVVSPGFSGFSGAAIPGGGGATSWLQSPQAALANVGSNFAKSNFSFPGVSSLLQRLGDGGNGEGGWTSWLGPLMSVGSGIYGMDQANRLKRLAMELGTKADPWGASGGRSLADAQLQALLKDPGQVASKDPSFELAQQAAARASSQTPGGAQAVAAANASNDWLIKRMQALSGPAGVNFAPGTGSEIALSGAKAGAGLSGDALASIGYGVNTVTGGGAMPAWLTSYLIQHGLQ